MKGRGGAGVRRRWSRLGPIPSLVVPGAAGLLLVFPLLLPGTAGRLLAQESADRPRGQETADRVQVTVHLRSDSGVPVSGGRVRLLPLQAEEGGLPGPRVELPEDGPGRYVAEGVRPGTYRLTAAAPGYRDAARRAVLAPPSARLALTLGPDPLPLEELVARVRRDPTSEFPGHAVSHVAFHGAAAVVTLGEWLAGLSGVDVRRRGPAGPQVVSVRGSRPEGVLVLLDGLPLNDPATGAADLSAVPVATLESATLVRGASGGRGPGALAGVLILRSRRPEGNALVAAGEAGSYGSRAGDLYLSLAGEAGALAISGRYERSENDFPFENRVHPRHPTERRRNADRRAVHATAVGSPSDLPVTARLRLDDVERGAPGRMGTRLFDRARWRDRAMRAALQVGEAPGAHLLATGAVRHLRYTDPARGEVSRQRAADVRLRGELSPDSRWEVSAHLAREAVSGDDLEGAPARLSGGLALARPIGGSRLDIRPSVAVDLAPGVRALSPELTVRARPGEEWRLWARAGRGIRLPTFADLYFASAHGVRPNPDLRPERAVLDAEAGAEWRPGPGVRLRASAFHRRVRDPIVWLASSVAVWSPRNLGALDARGVEAEVAWEPAAGWRVDATASLDRSRVDFGENRNPLPYAPAWRGRVAVERLLAGGTARVELRLTGARTTSLAATRVLPAFGLVDLAFRRPLRLAGVPLEAALRVENLLDAGYELVELFPEPGREVQLRIGLGPFLWGNDPRAGPGPGGAP